MKELPSPTEIQYFKCLAEVGNVTRAADLVGLTQPALSSAIKRLEEKVGYEMFIRSKKGVELNRSGKLFLQRSSELMSHWQSISIDLDKASKSIREEFRIGIHPSVAIICLPQALQKFKKAYPGISLKLAHDLSRNVNEQILKKEVDFGIVVNPRKHPDLILKKICDDEVKIWSSLTHNIKNRTLIYDQNLFQSNYIVSKIAKTKQYTEFIEVGSLELIREMGLAGNGDVVLPQRVANKPNQKVSFKAIKQSPTYKDEFYFVRNQQSEFNLQEKQMIRFLYDCIYKNLNLNRKS